MIFTLLSKKFLCVYMWVLMLTSVLLVYLLLLGSDSYSLGDDMLNEALMYMCPSWYSLFRLLSLHSNNIIAYWVFCWFFFPDLVVVSNISLSWCLIAAWVCVLPYCCSVELSCCHLICTQWLCELWLTGGGTLLHTTSISHCFSGLFMLI